MIRLQKVKRSDMWPSGKHTIEKSSNLYVEKKWIAVIEECFGVFGGEERSYSEITLSLEGTPKYYVYESPNEIEEKLKYCK